LDFGGRELKVVSEQTELGKNFVLLGARERRKIRESPKAYQVRGDLGKFKAVHAARN